MDNEDLKVRFCIPPIGAKVMIAEDWVFWLYNEYKNEKFAYRMNAIPYNKDIKFFEWQHFFEVGTKICRVTAPAGTILTVRRIYVRQGRGEYDSVTFSCPKGSSPNKKFQGKFWARLEDVNKMVCFPMDTDLNILESFVPDADQAMLDRFSMMISPKNK